MILINNDDDNGNDDEDGDVMWCEGEDDITLQSPS